MKERSLGIQPLLSLMRVVKQYRKKTTFEEKDEYGRCWLERWKLWQLKSRMTRMLQRRIIAWDRGEDIFLLMC